MSDDLNQLPIADLEIDCSGLTCPLPILRTKQALSRLSDGEILKVFTTDPNSENDFKSFSKHTGHVILFQKKLESGCLHFFKKVKMQKI